MSAPNFDRIARLYRWFEYASLGPLLERTRNRFLPALADRRQALILGDGDGRFTARLLATHLQLRAHAVDTSGQMLTLLRRRAASSAARLTTQQADARDVLAPPATDLIITHFFLDCLTQSEADTLIARTASALPRRALWLLSEFRIPPGPLHWPAKIYIRALYLAFRILTDLRVTSLPDYETPLKQAGFACIEQRSSLLGLLTSELWQKIA